jgi:hypothetical protein
VRVRVSGVTVDVPAVPVGEPLAARVGVILSPVNEPTASPPRPAENVRLITESGELDTLAGPPPNYPTTRPASEVASIVSPVAPVVVALGDRSTGRQTELVLAAPAAANQPPLLFVSTWVVPDATIDPDAVPGRRLLQIDWPLTTRTGNFGLLLPGERRSATLWRVTVEPVTDASAADVQSELAKASAATRPAPTTTPAGPGVGLAAALRSSSSASNDVPSVRRSLLCVAAETDADLLAEAALLLDDASSLRALLEAVAAHLEAAPPGTTRVGLGWAADRGVLQSLGKLLNENALPPAASAMCSARYGEVGRSLATLNELAAASTGRADFHARVEAEHVLLLDDASPAARVRALDWVNTHSTPVQGYDPMGPVRQRRAAVERYLREKADAATRPVQPNNPPTSPTSSRP